MDNKEIVDFLESVKQSDFEQFEIVYKLRELVYQTFPEATEVFKYGGIVLSLKDQFGGIFVYKNHVSFEFSFGYKLQSDLKLEGSGKYRRHLKFKKLKDIDANALIDLLNQIQDIDDSL